MESKSTSSDIISSSKGTPRRSNYKIVDVEQLSRDTQADFRKLRDYFTPEILEEHMLPIIMYKSTLSLRLLDWLVTNYSKAHACEYALPNRMFEFNIHVSYRAKLSELGKSGFDPFCRDNRIYFRVDDKRKLLTTIGQLNFFRWAIENQVLAFAKANLQKIEEHMNSVEVRQAPKRTKSNGQPAKRRELSRAQVPTSSIVSGNFSLDHIKA